MTDPKPLEMPVHAVSDLPVTHPSRPVGRDDDLRSIYTLLQNRDAVLLHGASGMGKTTVAAALASAYVSQPGGVLWLTVDNTPLAELIVRIGRAYGSETVMNSSQPIAMIGAVAGMLAEHKPLIVMDGQPDERASTQFLSKCAAGLPVLITSDYGFTGGPWINHELDALEENAAMMLFKQKSGITSADADADVAAIADLLGGMPYPIVVAARAMAAGKQQPADYLATLEQVAEAAHGDALMTALTASYRALNNALQGLLLMLGATYRGEASAELLSIISGVPVASIDQAMTVLSQLFLVEKFNRCNQPYYRLHHSAHLFAAAWLRGSNRLESLHERVRAAVLKYLDVYGQPEQVQPDRLIAEMDNFVATAHWAAEGGFRETTHQIVTTLSQANGFVKRNGFVYELLIMRSAGAGSTTAFPAYTPEPAADDLVAGDLQEDNEEEEAEEMLSEATSLSDVPEVPVSLDVMELDQLRVALNQARQQQDLSSQFDILDAIASQQRAQGKDNEAIVTYNELLTLYETAEAEGLLDVLVTLSSLLVQTSNAQAAIMHITRGIKLAEDDPLTRMKLLSYLGDARQELGESGEAIVAYDQARTLAGEHRAEEEYAILQYKLGYAYLDHGDTDLAMQTWESARGLFKARSMRRYEGRVLGGLAAANAEMARWSEAIRFHTSALHIAREVGDRDEEWVQLSSLAQALVENGQLPDALLRYRQALHVAYTNARKDEVVGAIVELVRLMIRSDRLLNIARLLIEDAVRLDAGDRDVRDLASAIEARIRTAEEEGVRLATVGGTAAEYAANAYRLLDE